MPIVKVIEVIASSEKGFDDAVKNAVAQASKTVSNIQSVYVENMKCQVEGDEIVSFGVNAKISFTVK